MKLSRREMDGLLDSVAYALDHDGTDTLADAVDGLLNHIDEEDYDHATHGKIYSAIIRGAIKGVRESIIKLNVKR